MCCSPAQLTEWMELQECVAEVLLRVKETRFLFNVFMVEAKEPLAVRVMFTP